MHTQLEHLVQRQLDTDWSTIVPGDFARDRQTGLLFYNGEFGMVWTYGTDKHGSLQHKGQTSIGNATAIVDGSFGGGGHTDYLVYDDTGEECRLYGARDDGRLTKFETHSGWSPSWTTVVSGDFVESGFTDLLFYNRQTGEAELHAGGKRGELTSIQTFEIDSGLTAIVPGRFNRERFENLLAYDAESGTVRFYATDRGSGLEEISMSSGGKPGQDIVVAGEFGGDERTDLVFYDAGEGNLEMYALTDELEFRMLGSANDLTREWDIIVPGYFGGDGFTDLLFYDRQTGEAEFHLIRVPMVWQPTADDQPMPSEATAWSDYTEPNGGEN